MAKMGRPKSEKPLDKRVTIRLNEEEFTILVEYAQNHDITVTQAVKSCIQEKILNRCYVQRTPSY